MQNFIKEYKLHFAPVLSANPDICQTDYTNDQSWEISLDPKHPSGIALETNFGLQARIAQVFPVFLDANNLPIHDPRPVYILKKMQPEQVQYQVALFPDMDVMLTLRVPDSHTLTGEVVFHSRSASEKKVQAGVLMRLGPIENGQIMTAGAQGNRTILEGESGELHPVLMTTGLPAVIHRPHPGLALALLVSSNHPATFKWVVSSEMNLTESIDHASTWINQSWAGITLRSITRFENDLLTIRTGSEEVDEALYLSQVQTGRLLLSATDRLPFPAIIHTRQPDQGYSPRGDGNDYPAGWRGPSAWDLYYFTRYLLLPGQAETAAGMFHNFIQVQQGYGNVDLWPGLGGQRAHLLAPPLLASTGLEIFRYTRNTRRLAEAYPILNYFFNRWLDSEHDRDQDGLPEWDHPLQTGWENNPLVDAWQEGSRGYDSESIESPALGALLYREGQSLAEIAVLLGKPDGARQLQEPLDRIREQVEKTWDKRQKIYRYRDRDTHRGSDGGNLTRGVGSGTFPINRSFDQPIRVCLVMQSKQEASRPAGVEFIGVNAAGEHVVDQVPPTRIIWRDGRAIITCKQVLTQLEAISISGLAPKEDWVLSETDLRQVDLSLFLPLWAGIPNPENAARMINQNLIPNWIEPHPFGLPMLPVGGSKTVPAEVSQRVHLPLLAMVIDGLLEYGFQAEANRLVNEVMEAIIKVMKATGRGAEAFHAGNGSGMGEVNHLYGMAPTGLFLRNLGVWVKDVNEAAIWNTSPYPQDVEIRFRGMRIIRAEKSAEIIFPDGQQTRVNSPGRTTILWKKAAGGK
jgi:hypothetical protein